MASKMHSMETKKTELPYTMPIEVLEEVRKIISEIPSFKSYLIEWNHEEDFDLPYMVFWMLIDFIRESYDNNDIKSIRDVLGYLENMLHSEDKNIRDLLYAGALEVFDKELELLPSLVDLMGEDLKKEFLHWFWHMLDAS